MAGREGPHPTLRVARLNDAEGVQREAGRLYRAARQGKVAPADAARLGEILALIMRTIEGPAAGRNEAR